MLITMKYKTMFKAANILTKLNIPARNFWTLAEGRSIGYIENVGKAGIFFTNKVIKFRETSSNLSNGEVFELSTEKLNKNSCPPLHEIMYKKKPVYVEYNEELFGFPWNGETSGPTYVTKIGLIDDEIININNTK